MKRFPIYIPFERCSYSTIWDLSVPNDVRLIMSTYGSKREVQSWANGRKNREYFMAVI